MLVLVPVAYVAGQWAMGAFYGDGFTATGADLAILTGGVAAYLVAATVAQGAIARGDAGAGGVAWGVAAVTFVGLSLALGGSPLYRVSVAFLVGSGVAAILSTLALARGSSRPLRVASAPAPARRGLAQCLSCASHSLRRPMPRSDAAPPGGVDRSDRRCGRSRGRSWTTLPDARAGSRPPSPRPTTRARR